MSGTKQHLCSNQTILLTNSKCYEKENEKNIVYVDNNNKSDVIFSFLKKKLKLFAKNNL